MKLIVLWLAGCAGPPTDPRDCPDAECRRAWVEQRWDGDGPTGASVLGGAREPVERLALVTAMLDKHPDAGKSLCEHVTQEDALALCDRRRGRGHLWETPSRPEVSGPRAAPGPATSPLRTAETLESSLSKVPPADAACGAQDEQACRLTLGVERAVGGDAAGAAAVCAGIGSVRWRSECTFRAAEGLVDHAPQAYADGLELCLLSGDFATNCQGHLLRSLAHAAPVSTTPGTTEWAEMLRRAELVKTTWQQRDPARADEMTSRFWSEVLLASYATADVVTGDPLDAVPAEAAPHVRAAAAMRLAQLHFGEGWTLAEWYGQLAAAMDQRAAVDGAGGAPVHPGAVPAGPGAAPDSRTRPRGAVDWWPLDGPGDDAIPAIAYLATSRRAVSDDPSVDQRICMLEALARLPDEGTLVQERLADSDPLVVWTGQRLARARRAQGITGGGPGGAPPEREPPQGK